MIFKTAVKGVVAVVMTMALAACGGGGGSSPEPVLTKMGGSVQGRALPLSNSLQPFAGSAASTDGTASTVRFNLPGDVATDGTNLFVADTANSTIRRVTLATGATTTLAGIAGLPGSSDGTGPAARFNFPSGIATDGTNVYVSDTGNNTIRKIVIASGEVSTLAGTAGTLGAANGTGAAASFSAPAGLATDGTDLYVADSQNHAIRKIVIASGAVTTIAGSGTQDFTDGNGVAATFNTPRGLASDGTSLYVADYGNSAVRRIVLATGFVSTLAAGPSFLSPVGIATDGTSLFVSDEDDNVVRTVNIASQAVTTLAGASGAPGAVDATGGAAKFSAPAGLALSGTDLYVADAENGTIRKVTAAGAVTTVIGVSDSADGTGLAAGFNTPYDLTTDGTNIYVADSGNHTIRKVAIATGAVTTLSGTPDLPGSADGIGAAAGFSFPSGITTDGTSLFVSDTDNHTIRKIVLATGAVSTLAGTAGVIGSADGTGGAASFNGPSGITTDETFLYLADSGNNSIRKIEIATGAVTTLSGAAGLVSPFGITTDGTSLYVSDTGNNRICGIAIATSVLTPITVTGATFSRPSGITTDGVNLYLADTLNSRVIKISIATGTASIVQSGLMAPNGITTDGTSLYVTDVQENRTVAIR